MWHRFLGLLLTSSSHSHPVFNGNNSAPIRASAAGVVLLAGNPGNGYGNSSSKRIIFGIPKQIGSLTIEITWPNGHVQKFVPDKIDRYYEITEQN